MKRVIYVFILLVAIIVAFIMGMVVGKGNNNKDDVVGVYQTDSWNGKIGTLVIYDDGTCQYPSGGNATWNTDGNSIHITLESSYTIQDGNTKGINIFIDNELPNEKVEEILNIIQGLNNIESVNWIEETNICKITLVVAESDNTTSKELSKIDGVTIIEYVLEKGVQTSEHEAKIMENGLVLHGTFFEKVSD